MEPPETPGLDLDAAASTLWGLLMAVQRGELDAPGPMIAHLRGALAALEALGATIDRSVEHEAG